MGVIFGELDVLDNLDALDVLDYIEGDLFARFASLDARSEAHDFVERHLGDRAIFEKSIPTAGILKDGVSDHGTIVDPGVPWTIGILQELFGRTPVVLYGDERRTFVSIEVEPMIRVVDVGWATNAIDHILGDVGLGLRTEGIDASYIVHVTCIVSDAVAIDLIAAHAIQ